MRKVKFILNVIFMVLLTRPQSWKWEYNKIKRDMGLD